MAKKNIEAIYDKLFKLQLALEEISDTATEVATDIKAYGGEISRVVTDQLGRYFIPSIKSLSSDTNTPGSIQGLVVFLDSVPLAMTRQEPQVSSDTQETSSNLTLPQGSSNNPVDNLPQNASYANQVQEKKFREYTVYNVVRVSNAGGDIKPKGRLTHEDFKTKEEADKQADYLNSTVTDMERDLWDVHYVVEEVKRDMKNGQITAKEPKEVKPDKIEKVKVVD